MRNRRAASQAKRLRRNMTKAEAVLWTVLKARQLQGWKFRRQHPVGRYIVDFVCIEAGLAVEVDGATHASDAAAERDARRTQILNAQGFAVLRVANLDIYEDLDGVVRGIAAALAPLGPSGHSPRRRGETSCRRPISSPARGGGVRAAGGGGGRGGARP